MPTRIDPYELFSSWQEIADALRVSVRTARRYELHEGLRIRRLRGQAAGSHRSKGRVYATGKMLIDFIEGPR